MVKDLLDLLWRDSASAAQGRRRGPRSRRSTGEVVDRAVEIADTAGLGALTIRSLAESLEMTTMSVYTHVNSRNDLLVLMADQVHAQMPGLSHEPQSWQHRVRDVAETNLSMLRAHGWMLEIDDARVVLGPGTIAKYDHELHAFDGTGLDDVRRDAALTFVLGFARDAASRFAAQRKSREFGDDWEHVADRLQAYLGDAHPLAQSVGRAAGESMGAPYDVDTAWTFGLGRIVAGLDAEIETHP